MAEFVGSVTLKELYLNLVAISIACGGLWRFVDWVIKVWTKAKTPEKKQDERIAQAEKDIAEIRKMLHNDDNRLKELEDSNRLIHKALLSLLKHGIDGNDIESMRTAQREIEEYLINK